MYKLDTILPDISPTKTRMAYPIVEIEPFKIRHVFPSYYVDKESMVIYYIIRHGWVINNNSVNLYRISDAKVDTSSLWGRNKYFPRGFYVNPETSNERIFGKDKYGSFNAIWDCSKDINAIEGDPYKCMTLMENWWYKKDYKYDSAYVKYRIIPKDYHSKGVTISFYYNIKSDFKYPNKIKYYKGSKRQRDIVMRKQWKQNIIY